MPQYFFASDCCDCKIEITQNGEYIKSVRKCKIHENSTEHFKDMIDYNRNFTGIRERRA